MHPRKPETMIVMTARVTPAIQRGASTELANVMVKERVTPSRPSNKPPTKIRAGCWTLGSGAKYARTRGERMIDPFQQKYKYERARRTQKVSSAVISPGSPSLPLGAGCLPV